MRLLFSCFHFTICLLVRLFFSSSVHLKLLSSLHWKSTPFFFFHHLDWSVSALHHQQQQHTVSAWLPMPSISRTHFSLTPVCLCTVVVVVVVVVVCTIMVLISLTQQPPPPPPPVPPPAQPTTELFPTEPFNFSVLVNRFRPAIVA